MPNGTYGGVRGRKTKVGRKLSFSSYSIWYHPSPLFFQRIGVLQAFVESVPVFELGEVTEVENHQTL